MTALTPEDAKTKMCPLSMAREKLVRCQGPACMVWRWSEQERQDAKDAFFIEHMKAMGVDVTGPKKPAPLQVAQGKSQAAEDMKGWTGTTGFCGLGRE